jgi:cytochrome c-type biogenesis protein CcmH/NrfF
LWQEVSSALTIIEAQVREPLVRRKAFCIVQAMPIPALRDSALGARLGPPQAGNSRVRVPGHFWQLRLRGARLSRWLLPLALFFLLSLSLSSVHAAESPEERERRAQEIIRSTMSPFCPGRTVDSCPSPSAAAWRDDVRAWVDQGVSTQEIRRRLEQRAPETDLTGAPSTAMDAVMPIFLTVTAVAFLALLLRALLSGRRAKQQRALAEKKASKATPENGDLDRRLDDELAQLDD